MSKGTGKDTIRVHVEVEGDNGYVHNLDITMEGFDGIPTVEFNGDSFKLGDALNKVIGFMNKQNTSLI